MPDKLPEWEQADKKGTTEPFEGTVGTSWVAVPPAPGGGPRRASKSAPTAAAPAVCVWGEATYAIGHPCPLRVPVPLFATRAACHPFAKSEGHKSSGTQNTPVCRIVGS